MSTFPMLPLFTDTFIADTGHLSGQETGAYLLLLMMAWRSPECRLPDADDKLARWARVDKRTWLRIKPEVMAFWTLTDGFWSQKRLRKEWDFVSKRAEVNRQNGKQGGRGKSLENKEPAKRLGSARDSEIKAPIPIPIASPEGEAARAAPPPVDRDELTAFQRRMFERFPAFAQRAASSPALLDMSPIGNLLRAGADLREDVEPVVVSILSRAGRPPTGWAYFRNPIEDAVRTRLETKPILGASTPAKAHTFLNPDGTRKPDHDGVVRLLKRSLTDGSWQSLEPSDPAIRRTLRLAVTAFRDGKGWDTEAFGSPPGHPACVIPEEIVEAILNPPKIAAE